MPRALGPADLLALQAQGLPVADVRSPGEFARGHLPGASSLPLFSDAERAEVGTAYKHQGRTPAVLLGLERVGPRLGPLAQQGLALAPGGRLALYCWRGGMRSGAVAWLLEQAGLEVLVLRGGYKAWRQHALAAFAQARPLVVLGGLTGSGKTQALHALARRGQQVLDLEALAAHQGSSFGAIGQPPPPTQEHFENRLAHAWLALDPARPTWVEDESRHLGRCYLPAALWAQLCAAPVLALELPRAARIDFLVGSYGGAPAAELAQAIERLRKRLGGALTQQALAALHAGHLATTCALLLDYYDRTYRHGLAQRPAGAVTPLPLPTTDPEPAAEALLSAASLLTLNPVKLP